LLLYQKKKPNTIKRLKGRLNKKSGVVDPELVWIRIQEGKKDPKKLKK
jgi:hypothetical protein